MAGRFKRLEDSTFDLNLAPMLDIIVSIVPMLLLSVVFVHVTMIETPIPQAVEQAMKAADNRDDLPLISIVISGAGFVVIVEQAGKKEENHIAMKAGALDFDALHAGVVALKLRYADVFRVELHPDDSVALDQIVMTMDKVRNRAKSDPLVYFNDASTGKKVETDLLFPDVVFGNVAGGGPPGAVAAGGE